MRRPMASVSIPVRAWILASAAMLLALLAPALWNGFPLIFPDTGGYLTRPIHGALLMGRSALYGLFLYAGIPLTFWPNVIAQAALVVWLIVLTLRAHGLGGRPWLALGIVAMLTASTSLPWLAGQLIPDIFFPAAVLALHLLAFRSEQLARWERFALAAAIAIAVPSHMAAAGMAVAIIAALWLLTRVKRLALPKPRLTFAAGSVAAGLALCPISNYAITGSFAFTPGGASFLFGRLIEDGIVTRYLDERCPDPRLRICAYQADVPKEADDWLWGNGSAFYKLGGLDGFGAEQNAIILATLARYPLMHARTAIAGTVRQFISFKTEVSVWDNDPAIGTFSDHTPQLLPQLMRARQQSENFSMGPLNLLHVPVAALAIAGLGLALVARRRLKVVPELAALCLTILLALAANAAICGIFSHPVDRYQSRLVPLAPFAVALLIARRQLSRATA
jgi:hypothetical protein